jgi:hypothetical protein
LVVVSFLLLARVRNRLRLPLQPTTLDADVLRLSADG